MVLSQHQIFYPERRNMSTFFTLCQKTPEGKYKSLYNDSSKECYIHLGNGQYGINPDYIENSEVSMGNQFANDIIQKLGYNQKTSIFTIQIDDFIQRSTKWLKQNIGTQHAVKSKICFELENINKRIHNLTIFAQNGKAEGATHIQIL